MFEKRIKSDGTINSSKSSKFVKKLCGIMKDESVIVNLVIVSSLNDSSILFGISSWPIISLSNSFTFSWVISFVYFFKIQNRCRLIY